MKVDFTTIVRGEDSGILAAQQNVINNKEQWADIWEEHMSNIEPEPPIPEVDFAREMVIAFFLGEKPTSGYTVEIISVETNPSQEKDRKLLVVKLKQRKPGEDEIVMDVMSQPHHIIKLPKIKAEQVIFQLVE